MLDRILESMHLTYYCWEGTNVDDGQRILIGTGFGEGTTSVVS